MTQLFGRDVELGRIARFLDRSQHIGDTRLVRGEPGVGKSALFAAAADMGNAQASQDDVSSHTSSLKISTVFN